MNTEQTSRPLSVLLPIAREYLCFAEGQHQNPENWSPYTCNAAQIAYRRKEMTGVEYSYLKNAISDKLWLEGYKCSTLYSYLSDSGHPAFDVLQGASDPRFFPIRDAWLDNLQQTFENLGV